jgi:hypothetical protein
LAGEKFGGKKFGGKKIVGKNLAEKMADVRLLRLETEMLAGGRCYNV